jgi:hypothetical protein
MVTLNSFATFVNDTSKPFFTKNLKIYGNSLDFMERKMGVDGELNGRCIK